MGVTTPPPPPPPPWSPFAAAVASLATDPLAFFFLPFSLEAAPFLDPPADKEEEEEKEEETRREDPELDP